MLRGEPSPWRRLIAQRPVRIALEVAIAMVGVLCAGLALAGELGRLRTDSLRFEPLWLLAAVVGFVALQLVHAGLWRWQLAELGSPLPPRRARAIWCASAVARYVPTSLLMPTIRIAMSERSGVPKRRCLASLVYEAALVLAGALVVAGYFVVELPQLRGHAVRWVAVALPVIALLALHPRVFRPVADAALRRARREPLAGVLPQRTLLVMWIAYAASFLLGGAALFALARGIYPLGLSALPQVVGAMAVGFAISILAFILPGGLGAREAGLVGALLPVMPTVVAIAVAILVRVVQIAIEITLAGVTPMLARRQPEAQYGPGLNVASAERQARFESMRRAEPRSASTKTTLP